MRRSEALSQDLNSSMKLQTKSVNRIDSSPLEVFLKMRRK
jgi:hypothetical protein